MCLHEGSEAANEKRLNGTWRFERFMDIFLLIWHTQSGTHGVSAAWGWTTWTGSKAGGCLYVWVCVIDPIDRERMTEWNKSKEMSPVCISPCSLFILRLLKCVCGRLCRPINVCVCPCPRQCHLSPQHLSPQHCVADSQRCLASCPLKHTPCPHFQEQAKQNKKWACGGKITKN